MHGVLTGLLIAFVLELKTLLLIWDIITASLDRKDSSIGYAV